MWYRSWGQVITAKEARNYSRTKHDELAGLEKRRTLGFPDSIAVSELLTKYEREYLPALSPNTRKSYPKSIAPIRTYFLNDLGDPGIETIRAKHVADFLSWRRVRGPRGELRAEPLSNRTLQKDRAILHRIFQVAEKLELRDGNPVGRVEAPKIKERDPVLLSGDELERLLTACGKHEMLHLWVLLLAETGVRSQSEALWIRWADVDVAGGFLWIDSTRHGRRTKSGRGRWVPRADGPAALGAPGPRCGLQDARLRDTAEAISLGVPPSGDHAVRGWRRAHPLAQDRLRERVRGRGATRGVRRSRLAPSPGDNLDRRKRERGAREGGARSLRAPDDDALHALGARASSELGASPPQHAAEASA